MIRLINKNATLYRSNLFNVVLILTVILDNQNAQQMFRKNHAIANNNNLIQTNLLGHLFFSLLSQESKMVCQDLKLVDSITYINLIVINLKLNLV